MTEQTTPPPGDAPGLPPAAPAFAPAPSHAPAPGHTPAAYDAGNGPVGQIRGTGVCIALAICTFGIYTLVWYYKVHQEMKNHSGAGLGGGVALLLAFFVSIVMPYLTSSEVGNLYARSNRPAPVSGTTGLWYFPGSFIIVGPLVWFIKTNGALNDYWRTQGAA